MSFLEDLRTFELPLNEGVPLDMPLYRRRTLWEVISGTKRQLQYWSHRTAAGLDVVLPHNEDGSLHIVGENEEGMEGHFLWTNVKPGVRLRN